MGESYASRTSPIIQHGDEGVTGVWSGGPYIDIYWTSALGHDPETRLTPTDDSDPPTPFTTIGVYDYEAGKPTISTRADVAGKIAEWVEENRGDLGGWLEMSIG